jgi:hypothetical protein
MSKLHATSGFDYLPLSVDVHGKLRYDYKDLADKILGYCETLTDKEPTLFDFAQWLKEQS